MTKVAVGTKSLQIKQEATIYEVAELKQQILDFIETDCGIDFDLSKVSSLDSAVVQLLLATKIELESRDLSFGISALSDKAREHIANACCDDFLILNSDVVNHG